MAMGFGYHLYSTRRDERTVLSSLGLGASLEAISAKQAVFLSALLFAMAHPGTPLCIPTLTLLGNVLGMLRLLNCRLILPMLFHFFHNLLVVLLEPFL
jgi:membrane protease YdiL (CAAX protease family)